MTKSFWNNTLKKIKQMKKLMISIVVVFTIIFLTILSLIKQDSQYSKTTQQIPISQLSEGNLQTTPTATITSIVNLPKWTTFNGSSFSLQYSPDWTLQRGNIAGGEIVIIKPNSLPQEINYPHFILQTEDVSTERIDQKMAFMKSLGLKQTEINIFNQPAYKLSGTIQLKKIAGKIVKEPIQETNILITKGNKLYLLQYAYEGANQNEILESYFNEFIQGIQLK